MIPRTIRKVGSALLLGAAIFSLNGVAYNQPAAAAQATIKTAEVAKPVQEAQALAKDKKFKEAIAKLREAQGIAKGAELGVVNQLILSYAVSSGDTSTAMAMLDQMMTSGQINKNEGNRTGMQMALKAGNTDKAVAYADALGDAMTDKDRAYVAQAYYKKGNCRKSIEILGPVTQGANPDLNALQLLAACYYQLKDDAGGFKIQELLVANYPSPERWHAVITSVGHFKGMSGDSQKMELYRLRLAVGDLKTQQDFSETAQFALLMSHPKEAEMIVNKGTEAKLLEGERSQRLVTSVAKAVTDDSAKLAALQQAAQTGANGDASVQLGETLWTYGKLPEAEAAVRAGIKKGSLTDPDEAKIILGHILLTAGKKAEAAQAFNSVAKGNKWEPVGRLWAINARNAPIPSTKDAKNAKAK